jgi:hypothetical protein
MALTKMHLLKRINRTTMNDNISTSPTAAEAYRAMLAEQTYASLEEAQIEEAEENEFSMPKNKKENYRKFLAANEHRVGKPMLDGGLNANHRDADKVNGHPVNDQIYCGAGCITFKHNGEKVFIQMNSGLLDTSDGTLSWGKHKSYSGDAYISTSGSEFKDIAKALSVAAKV